MKLRWSNNTDFAVTFEANDLASFRQQALSAMRSFRIATEYRVHRGEIRKTVSRFPSATLHVGNDIETGWYNPGIIKQTESGGLQGLQFFDPITIMLGVGEANSPADQHPRDEIWFLANADKYWQACVDTYRWLQALNLMIMQVGDEIDRYAEAK